MVKILSVRSETRPIADDVVPDPSVVSATSITILIHGYQNSPTKARRSYWRFEDTFRSAGRARARARLGEVWGLLWPGNHENQFLSVVTYSLRIQPAVSTGERLADFINRLNPGTTVRLIGHSLGCRVALETMRQIARLQEKGIYKGPDVEDVFLLAAAVPVPLCKAGSDSFPTPRGRCAEHVYWSRRDSALDWKFRAGQSWFKASERGAAVGRTGDPNRRWTSRLETDLRHGDYWDSPLIARIIADQVSLGRTARLGRVLPEDAPDSWALEERLLDERFPDERGLAA